MVGCIPEIWLEKKILLDLPLGLIRPVQYCMPFIIHFVSSTLDPLICSTRYFLFFKRNLCIKPYVSTETRMNSSIHLTVFIVKPYGITVRIIIIEVTND